MLKSDEKVIVSNELLQHVKKIIEALDKCGDLALLQQPLTNKQIDLMTDASFAAAGYAVLIEDGPDQKSIRSASQMPQWLTDQIRNLHPSPILDVSICKRISSLSERVSKYVFESA